MGLNHEISRNMNSSWRTHQGTEVISVARSLLRVGLLAGEVIFIALESTDLTDCFPVISLTPCIPREIELQSHWQKVFYFERILSLILLVNHNIRLKVEDIVVPLMSVKLNLECNIARVPIYTIVSKSSHLKSRGC